MPSFLFDFFLVSNPFPPLQAPIRLHLTIGLEGVANLKKVKQKRPHHFCSNLCKVEKLVKSDKVWGSINSSIWSDEA